MNNICDHTDGGHSMAETTKEVSNFGKFSTSSFTQSLEETWSRMGKGEFQISGAIAILEELEQLFLRCVELSTSLYTEVDIRELQNKVISKTDTNGHFQFCASYNCDNPCEPRSILEVPTCLCSASSTNPELTRILKAEVIRVEWIFDSAFAIDGMNQQIQGFEFTKANLLDACSEQNFLDHLGNYTRYAADVNNNFLYTQLIEYKAKHAKLFSTVLNSYKSEQRLQHSDNKEAYGKENREMTKRSIANALQECGLVSYIRYKSGTTTRPRLSARRSSFNVRGGWEIIDGSSEYGSTDMLERADFQGLAVLWQKDYERLRQAAILPSLRDKILNAMLTYKNKWFGEFRLVADESGKIQPRYTLSSMAKERAQLVFDEEQALNGSEDEWVLLDY